MRRGGFNRWKRATVTANALICAAPILPAAAESPRPYDAQDKLLESPMWERRRARALDFMRELNAHADGTTYEVRAAQVASDALSSGYGTFSLFTCERTDRRSCTEVDELRGGFGTTGEAVVFTIPLAAVGLADGGRLTGLRAYSAHGSLLTGALRTLDGAAL